MGFKSSIRLSEPTQGLSSGYNLTRQATIHSVRPAESAGIISQMFSTSLQRYDYCVKRVADWQEAWSIEDERGWLTVADDSGVVHVPLWPQPYVG